MKRRMIKLFAVCGPLALAACGTSAPTPAIFCPQPAVLQQAGTLTLFLPGRQDVAAEVTTAKITGLAGSCALVKKNSVLRVTFQAGFVASNGPANKQTSLTLPYFVAIARGDDIVSKTPYGITLNFDGNVTSASATSKKVTVELSNVPESSGIDLLLGFQMTPEQLAYAAAHPDGF